MVNCYTANTKINFPIADSYRDQFKIDKSKRPSQRRSKCTLIKINHRKALRTVAITQLKHRNWNYKKKVEYHMVREWASPFSNLEFTNSWKKKKMEKNRKKKWKKEPCGSSRFASASLNHRQGDLQWRKRERETKLERELWTQSGGR